MRTAKKISLSIFWFVLISILAVVSSQQCINETGFFESKSEYDVNRGNILSSLADKVSYNGGFYNSSIGKDSGKVYAMGMCFDGTEKAVCSECIGIAVEQLIHNCPTQTLGFTWTPHRTLCFARYSNDSFFGKHADHPLYSDHTSVGIKSYLESYDKEWKNTTNVMRGLAKAKNGSLRNRKYYSTATLQPIDLQALYGFMQCTPDLDPSICDECLTDIIRAYYEADLDVRGKQGGSIAYSSCIFRWDIYPFTGTSDFPVCPKRKKNIPKEIIVVAVVVVPTVVIISVMSAVIALLVFRRRKSDFTEEIPTKSSLQYDLKTLEAATSTFSKCNVLGQGGFGDVFKGVLQDGSEIAVKRLTKESAQGVQEFKNETRLVAKLQHKNLVTVLGFCMEGEEKILVYEFVPNKSLDHFLFEPNKQGQLDWAKRYAIIVGTAKGILYLHHDSPLKIIHRDLKASNILLDAEMKPKVADFGMARILEMDQSRAATRRVVGTHGYISPEYMMHGQFSTKSDVYSFGVLLLEVISGKRNSTFHEIDNSGKNLVTHAWSLWRNGSPLELVDAELGKKYESNEVIRCIHIALLCVQNDPEERPNLLDIILMLTSNSISLPAPESPGYTNDLPPIISVPVSTSDSLISDLVAR